MKAHTAEESYKDNTKLKWILLLLALLINFLLFFLLFLVTIDYDFLNFPNPLQQEAPVVFEQMAEPPAPPLELPEFKPQELAALKPGASNFGIPDDEQEDALIAQPLAQEPLPEKPDESEQNQLLPEESVIPQQHELDKEQPQEIAAPNLESKTQIEKVDEQKKEIKQPEKKPQQKPIEQKREEKIKAPLKKELNFEDLAKGFLSSLNEGGNDLVERKGNENIRPDFEEMRTLSYQHKLIWYMQNEWRRISITIDCPVPPFVYTGVSMTINKDGTLTNAKIIQSCGVQQLDDAVLQGIKAASPYPSLPNFLNKESFTFEFGVKHVNNNTANMNYRFH